MSKKIMIVLAILGLLSISVMPITFSKPSSDKNNPNFEYFLWRSTNPREPAGEPQIGGSIPIEVKITPPDSDPAKITHTYATWTLDPAGEHTITIGDGETTAITGYEGTLHVHVNQITPTLMALNYRVYERIEWDGNYVEIMANERASFDLATGIFYASGTFTGKGEVNEQNVHVMGVREGTFEYDPVADVVIFVLDNVGTMQYLGN